MPIKTDVKELENDKVLLTVEVPEDQISVAIKRAYVSLAGKISIPGFRKGKIPKEMIDMRLGKEAVYQEAIDTSIPLYYRQALKEAKVEPIDKGEIEVKEISDTNLIFEATVTIVPRPELCDYKAITVDSPKISVTDTDVDEELDNLRGKFARFAAVTDRKAKEKDLVVIDMDIFVDGKSEPVKDVSLRDYLLEIGGNRMGLDIELKLVDAEIGKAVDVEIDMPSDHEVEEMAGKLATHRIMIKEIKEKVLPDLDDELAKNISEHETLAELKKDLKEQMLEQKTKKAQEKIDEEVMEYIIENSKITLPDILVSERTDHMVKIFEDTLRSKGLDIAEYLEITKMTLNDLKRDYEKSSTKHLKTDLVLKEVVRLENIEISDEELDKELAAYSQQQGKELATVKNDFEKRGQLDEIRENIAVARALELVSKNIKITYSDIEKKADEPEAELKIGFNVGLKGASS